MSDPKMYEGPGYSESTWGEIARVRVGGFEIMIHESEIGAVRMTVAGERVAQTIPLSRTSCDQLAFIFGQLRDDLQAK